jgi:uncharacterized membrane protein YhaH (DUF805 family)
MTFQESISTCMAKYATFEGRASRSEFWWFYLFTLIVSWAAMAVSAIVLGGSEELTGALFELIVNLVFLVPSLAVGARRLHDIGMSGWWQLLVFTCIGIIVLIVWWATDTNDKGDRYNI